MEVVRNLGKRKPGECRRIAMAARHISVARKVAGDPAKVFLIFVSGNILPRYILCGNAVKCTGMEQCRDEFFIFHRCERQENNAPWPKVFFQGDVISLRSNLF